MTVYEERSQTHVTREAQLRFYFEKNNVEAARIGLDLSPDLP